MSSTDTGHETWSQPAILRPNKSVVRFLASAHRTQKERSGNAFGTFPSSPSQNGGRVIWGGEEEAQSLNNTSSSRYLKRLTVSHIRK